MKKSKNYSSLLQSTLSLSLGAELGEEVERGGLAGGRVGEHGLDGGAPEVQDGHALTHRGHAEASQTADQQLVQHPIPATEKG